MMELINKRYRIVRSIKQNRFVSCYLVIDEKVNGQQLQLNIINSEYLPENLLNYYIKEFNTLTTIESANHVRLYDFEIIRHIDNKSIDKRQYFYTNDYVENETSLLEFINNIDEEGQLELIVKLCQSFNYLHSRGFTYGDISNNSILICDSNIKIKDIASKELEKYDYWSLKENQLVFKAPEILEGKPSTIASDIYSLGVLISFILKKEITNNLSDIKQELIICGDKDKTLICRLAPILEKMMEADENVRYTRITQIIEDINSTLNKDYKAHRIEEIEKINFNTKLIGRDYEINNTFSLFNSMVKVGTLDKFLIVHGEYGAGKTRFLKEIERLMLLNGINVFSSFTLENPSEDINKGIYEIIKKLTYECDIDTLERYEGELIKLIPELGQKKEVIPYETLGGEKEKIKVIAGICDFINDFIKGRPMVFIIDNIHRANDFSLELLEHLYLRSKNLMIIVSYCEGEFSNSNKLTELITKLSGRPNVIEMPLRGLNSEDSVTLIHDMLRMPQKAKRFAGTVFLKTYGNPLFIEEILKNLLASRAIYVNDQTGRWYSDFDDYSKLPMPANMEQAVLAQVKDIDEISNDILKAISIFNSGIPAEVITSILEVDADSLLGRIEILQAKGVICKKIEDTGFVYDFSNRILKNIIRERLDNNYRKKMHKIAALLLEKQYEEGIDNKEELIYHLEKAGQKEKVIKYCLDNADKMEAFKNRSEAIRNLKRALSVLEEEEEAERRIKLLHRLGCIYEDEGFRTEALSFFEETEALAIKYNKDIYQIAAVNKIANIYKYRNELGKAQGYVDRVEELLKDKELEGSYLEEYLQCIELKVRILYLKQDYNTAAKLCGDCINLCKNNFKLKGLFYKDLGNVYLNTSKISEAVKCYQEGMNFFEKANYTEGTLLCMNNLAVAYGDYYQDNEMAINYFQEMKEISERNHIINYQIMALTNLASSYCYEFDYEMALQYFLESLEKSRKIDYESNVFYCYNYLCFVYIGLQNYKEAYKYNKLAQKELELYPEQGKEISTYYQMEAEFCYAIGALEEAKINVEKALNIINEEDSIAKWDCEILLEYINLEMAKAESSIYSSVKKIKSLILNYKAANSRINILYNTAVILYDKGIINQAFELFNSVVIDDNRIYPNTIEFKREYLCALYCINESKEKLLTSLLGKCVKDKNIYWKVSYALGDYYLASRDYFNSINFYFKAAEVIKNLTMQLPEKRRIEFINSKTMVKPFKRLFLFIKYKDYNKLSSVNIEEEIYEELVTKEDLSKIFNYESIEDILSNKFFIMAADNIYNSYKGPEINGIQDIIKNLYSNPMSNLEMILKYLEKITLSTRGSIIVDSYERSYYSICSTDGVNSIPSNKLIFDKVKAAREPLLIKENLMEHSNSELSIMLQDLKALICLPIVMKSDAEGINNNLIKGYIYLESDRVLNNFSLDILERCAEVSRLIGINLERYQLQLSSSMDKLTGTLTRKSLEEAISENIEKGEAFGSVFSVIMMDMDHFKQINDKFGHQTGDEVLKKACSIIKSNLPKKAIFGRYGGEEFIILLPGMDGESTIAIANELREKVVAAKILGDKRSITLSMGISTFPHSAEWKEELIEKADQALYVAKEQGRNRCKLWISEFGNKTNSRNKLSGIVSGNAVQDSRNVLVMVDIIELIKQDLKLEEKIFSILGRIIENTESEYGWFFTVKEGSIKEVFSRKIFNEDWVSSNNFNMEIVSSVIFKKQGLYMTDWNEHQNYDFDVDTPEWNSVVVVPLIKNNIVKGVVYLSVPTKKKEFKFDEFNFVNTLGELTAAIL